MIQAIVLVVFAWKPIQYILLSMKCWMKTKVLKKNSILKNLILQGCFKSHRLFRRKFELTDIEYYLCLVCVCVSVCSSSRQSTIYKSIIIRWIPVKSMKQNMKWELELENSRFSFEIIAHRDCNGRARSCVIPLLRNFQNSKHISIIIGPFHYQIYFY